MKRSGITAMIMVAMLALFGLGGVAQAEPIQGTIATGFIDNVTINGTTLLDTTQINVYGMYKNTGGTGDFAGTPSFYPLGSNTLDLTNFSTWTWGSADFGTWTTTSGSIVDQNANGLFLHLEGSFTPGTYFSGMTENLGAMTISFSKSGGTTGYSGSMAMNPVPEPTTLALFATGMIGLLAYAWRRR